MVDFFFFFFFFFSPVSSVGLVEQNVLCRGKQIQQRHIVTHRSLAHVNEQNNQPIYLST